MSAKWFFKFPMLVKVPMSGFLGKSDDVVTFELLEKFRQWDFYKSDDVVRFDKMLSKSDAGVVFISGLIFETLFHFDVSLLKCTLVCILVNYWCCFKNDRQRSFWIIF